ncbi:MAG: NAD(P)-dependent oxidoreductase [Steroidobacteraceae bacterium]
MNVGFIGVGNMGAGMAANLIKAGHQVVVYNRTPEKMQALVAAGATPASQIADACTGDAVFTMLADDRAVEGVSFGESGIVRHLSVGAVHISSSTISVALSERLAAAHAQSGQQYVAAPVFGRPDAAATAQLFVVAAGAPQAATRAQPLLDAIGQRTFIVAEQPELANLIKISGNFLIAAVIESLGETMALVGKAGVDRSKYLEVLTSTLFNAPVYKNYGALIAERKYEPAGFAAVLGLKDVGLALTAAENLRVPMPLASLLRDRFLTLIANGGERLDWSAIGELAARDAGIAK